MVPDFRLEYCDVDPISQGHSHARSNTRLDRLHRAFGDRIKHRQRGFRRRQIRLETALADKLTLNTAYEYI